VFETLGHSQRKVYPVRSRILSPSNIKHNYAFVVFQLSDQILKAEVECHENVFSSHGVRLSPLGTAATVWTIVPAPDDNDCGATGGMRIGRGNRITRRKPAPVPLCAPQIPHDLTPGSNPGRRGGKPATNRLNCDTATREH
jgi:hypothetical protein